MPLLRRLLLASVFAACVVPATREARGEILWYWDGPASTPASILQQITASMDEAVAYYSAYSDYSWNEYSNDPRGIRVIYNSSVPTANASYRGRIAFGGSRGPRVAMHEMSHIFGVGTFEPTWTNLLTNRKWQGPAANAELQRFNGPGATLNGDGSHFWPYGLNFGNEDSEVNRYRHVRMVGALREDMGLSNGNASDVLADYNNDAVTDALDYIVWREREGQPGSLLNDEVPNAIDERDYAWWRRGYGSVAPQAVAVPEPVSAGTLAVLLVTIACGRRSMGSDRR